MYINRCSCQILIKLEFLDVFSKNPEISNPVKIRPVRAELFQADIQTDEHTHTTKLIVAFHNFANAPNSYII